MIKIADEVNEIDRDTDASNDEVTNEANNQTTDSVVDAPTDEINHAEGLVPDEVPLENVVTPADEPGLDNDDEEVIVTDDTTIEEAHDDTTSEADAEANDIDEVQINNEGDGAEPDGRYNLRTRSNVDYKLMHRYGETQLMQM